MAAEIESVEVLLALVSSKHSWANADLNIVKAPPSSSSANLQEP